MPSLLLEQSASASPVEIVTYEPIHRAAIQRLVAILGDWFEADAIESIDEELCEQTTLLALDGDGRAVGFLIVGFEDELSGRIRWAGVDPAFHRRGVGRALVAHVAHEASNAGLTGLYVETMSDAVDYEPFARTRAFYESLGFTPVRELGDLAGNGLLTTDWLLELVPVSANLG